MIAAWRTARESRHLWKGSPRGDRRDLFIFDEPESAFCRPPSGSGSKLLPSSSRFSIFKILSAVDDPVQKRAWVYLKRFSDQHRDLGWKQFETERVFLNNVRKHGVESGLVGELLLG